MERVADSALQGDLTDLLAGEQVYSATQVRGFAAPVAPLFNPPISGYQGSKNCLMRLLNQCRSVSTIANEMMGPIGFEPMYQNSQPALKTLLVL